MPVNIHKAGTDHPARRIDHSVGFRITQIADFFDSVIPDQNIPGNTRIPQAVINNSVF